MKSNYYPLLLFLIVFLLSLNIYQYICIEELLSTEDNEIKFVWNDDEESIPCDGENIKIEFTDENTVYIGPIW